MVDYIGGQLIVSIVQIFLGIVFSMGSIYIALRLFDRFTPEIDEWKEIKKGNRAIGIFLAGIIFSIAIIIESGVSNLARIAVPDMSATALVIAFVIGLLNLFLSVLIAVVAVYISIRVLDWITIDIDEIAELKKGNEAVAIMMLAVLFAVSFVIRGAVINIMQVISGFGAPF